MVVRSWPGASGPVHQRPCKIARQLCGTGTDKDKAVQDDGAALIMFSIRALGGGPIALWSWRRQNKTVQDHNTALILSSRSGHLEVARLLCGAGAYKDKAVQDDGALIMSSRPGHLEVARQLSGASADKDKAVQDDDTALSMSISIRAPGGGPTALWSWRLQGQGSAMMTQPWACQFRSGHLQVARTALWSWRPQGQGSAG